MRNPTGSVETLSSGDEMTIQITSSDEEHVDGNGPSDPEQIASPRSDVSDVSNAEMAQEYLSILIYSHWFLFYFDFSLLLVFIFRPEAPGFFCDLTQHNDNDNYDNSSYDETNDNYANGGPHDNYDDGANDDYINDENHDDYMDDGNNDDYIDDGNDINYINGGNDDDYCDADDDYDNDGLDDLGDGNSNHDEANGNSTNGRTFDIFINDQIPGPSVEVRVINNLIYCIFKLSL